MRSELDHFARLEIVRGRDDLDVVDRAQHREIVQGMVRRAQRAVTHAGADADQLDRVVAVADVVLDLLQGSRRQETGG